MIYNKVIISMCFNETLGKLLPIHCMGYMRYSWDRSKSEYCMFRINSKYANDEVNEDE